MSEVHNLSIILQLRLCHRFFDAEHKRGKKTQTKSKAFLIKLEKLEAAIEAESKSATEEVERVEIAELKALKDVLTWFGKNETSTVTSYKLSSAANIVTNSTTLWNKRSVSDLLAALNVKNTLQEDHKVTQMKTR